MRRIEAVKGMLTDRRNVVSQDHLVNEARIDANLPGSLQASAVMATLEMAALGGDSATFAAALDDMPWERLAANDFIQIIKLALKAGAHLDARQVAARALQQYPSDSEVKKFARVLSAPTLVSSTLPPAPGIEANRTWLKAHAGEYAGRWIALRAGELIAVNDSAKDLAVMIGDMKDVLLTLGR